MNVKVTTDGKRILVRFPYSKRAVSDVKTVPGANWNPASKEWRVPLTMDSCRTLRRVFGAQLEILPALADWARAELKAEAAREEIRSGAATARLVRVEDLAPQLALAIDARPYEKTGAAFVTLGRHVLLGDQPGLGKTLQALAAVTEAGAQRILVMCPRTTTRTVWARETNRWAPKIMPFVAQGSRAEREQVFAAFADTPHTGPKMLICNTEMARVRKGVHSRDPDAAQWPFLFSQKWDAIIFDESHQSLASTKNVGSKNITQVRYGAMKLRRLLADDGIALAMSGTPFRSDLAKSWGTLNWLRPDVFGSFWRFAGTHFYVADSGYNGAKEFTDANGRAAKSPVLRDEEAFAAALRPYYLARDKQEAAPDLPPIVYAGTPINGDGPNYVQLDMEPEQQEAYREMATMASADIEGGKLSATGILAEITRLRQFANSAGRLTEDGEFEPALPSAKLDWILEFLNERKGWDGKVVIASSFTRWINLLSRELTAAGFKNMTLTGATSDADRDTLVRRFADPGDKARVAIINTKAGGVGITLDAADDMILTDLPWKSDDERQVTDRIHRVSRIHNVTVYRLISTGTVDEWIAGLNDEQRQALLSADPDTLKKVLR